MHNILKQWIEDKKVEADNERNWDKCDVFDSLLEDLPQVLSRIEQELVEVVGKDIENEYWADTEEQNIVSGKNQEKSRLRTLLHTYCNKE